MAALRGKGLLRGAAADGKLVVDEFLTISLGSVHKGRTGQKKTAVDRMSMTKG
jgi:hypothetical protein